MKYTSDIKVVKCYDFLAQMKQPACPGCTRGIKMCHHTPCLGTVKDMERLLDAGFASSLMLDWWVGKGTQEENLGVENTKFNKNGEKWNPFDHDVYHLSPAILGAEGKQAPFTKLGTCALLKDDKCSLHDIGLKPVQGGLACCKLNRYYIDDQGNEEKLDERILILHTWNTQRGTNLIERWKKEMGMTEPHEIKVPSNMFDMLSCLMAIFHANVKMTEGNLQPIVQTKEVYQRPY